MKIIICIATLFAVTSPLLADVIIYTGTGKYSSASEQIELTVPAKVTAITDTATLETNLIFAVSFKVGNKKMKALLSPNLELSRADVRKGKSTVVNFASAAGNRTDANNFQASFARITGKVGFLLVRPESDPLPFPKAMTGSVTRISGLQSGANDTLELSTLTLRFSSTQSVSANSENLSLEEATMKVKQAYRDAGYDGGL